MSRVKHPFIIDIEASGFGPDSYPIEVGLAMEPGHKYSTLILPAQGWNHWDHLAEKVHNIDRKTLLSHGKAVQQVAVKLNALLEGRTVYSDGWVVDKPWMDTLFFTARMPMDFFVSPLELILSEHQMEIWHQQKSAIINETKPARHRASTDAWLIQQTFKQTLES